MSPQGILGQIILTKGEPEWLADIVSRSFTAWA